MYSFQIDPEVGATTSQSSISKSVEHSNAYNRQFTKPTMVILLVCTFEKHTFH